MAGTFQDLEYLFGPLLIAFIFGYLLRGFREKETESEESEACSKGDPCKCCRKTQIYACSPQDKMVCKRYCLENGDCNRRNCSFVHLDYMKKFFDELHQANSKIDICVFRIDAPDIVNKLIQLKQRGVRVRMVVEYSPDHSRDRHPIDDPRRTKHPDLLKVLVDNGIAIRARREPRGLMHNKFIVIDGKRAVFGSTNLSWGAFNHNDETFLTTGQLVLVQELQKIFNNLFRGYESFQKLANYDSGSVAINIVSNV